MHKLEILFKSTREFRQRNDVAIHILEPTFQEIVDAIERAERDMFPRIVVYSDRSKWGRFNIKASQSTWCKLIRLYGETADVRCGEVGYKHGRSDGDGFTIYYAVA